MNKLRVSLADSLDLFCGKSSARLKLQPGEHNPANPQIGLTLEVDTLFCRMGDTRLGMDKAGIGITAEKYAIRCGHPKASSVSTAWRSAPRNVRFPYRCRKLPSR